MNPLSGNPLKSRTDMVKAVNDLWRPLLPYYSKGGARVSLSRIGAHFSSEAAELEGFARPLWGVAPLVAGGSSFDGADLYLGGLSAGSDPDHEDYWGDVGDYDQRTVETAAIGFALRIAPEVFWDPLPDAAKQRLGTWLNGAINHKVPDCNWHFFKVLVALGLEEVGVPYNQKLIDESLAELDSYYIDDGWYRDGPGRRMEHYIPFAMHLYGLIYAQLRGDADPERAKLYRDRAAVFAPHYQHWFASDGAALPFGRSLTYRFAHASFWGGFACAGLGDDAGSVSLGTAKWLALENVRWWGRNADFDRDGILPIGYAYPNTYMAETYNSAQSPYWAMKAFLPLALEESHAFWTTPETPAKFESEVITQPIPGHVIFHEKGQTIALTGGQEVRRNMRMAPEKYEKFAYSTRYGFSVETDTRAFDSCVFDNMLGVSLDGINALVRTTCLDARIDGNMHYTKWQPCAEVMVETWLLAMPPGHLRVHRVTTSTSVHVTEGGFAIDGEGLGVCVPTSSSKGVAIENDSDFSAIRALVESDPREPRAHKAPPNSNLIAPRSFVPQLAGQLDAGEHLLVSYVVASPGKSAAQSAFDGVIEVPSIANLENRRDQAKTIAVWDAPVQ